MTKLSQERDPSKHICLVKRQKDWYVNWAPGLYLLSLISRVFCLTHLGRQLLFRQGGIPPSQLA